MRLTFLNLLLVTLLRRTCFGSVDASKRSSGATYDVWNKQNLFISDIEISKEYNYPSDSDDSDDRRPNDEFMYFPVDSGYFGENNVNQYQPSQGFNQKPQKPQHSVIPPGSLQNLEHIVRTSLVFAFDMSPSMSKQLDSLKQNLPNILLALHNNYRYQILEYIWLPFTYAGVDKPIITTDPQDFEKRINDTYITENRENCYGGVFEGVQAATKLALPDSFLYVFTHSFPKRTDNFEQIIKNVLKKRIRVSFVQLLGCFSHSYSTEQWKFDFLTALGSGQVYFENSNTIPYVLRYMAMELGKNDLVNLININRPAIMENQKLLLNVDDTVKEIFISISGVETALVVRGTNGDIYHFPDKDKLVDNAYTKVYRIPSPEVGQWEILPSSHVPYTFRIKACSRINFRVSYPQNYNSGVKLIDKKFGDDPKSNLMIYTNTDVDLTELCSIDFKGSTISCWRLSKYEEMNGIYYVKDFVYPKIPFFIEVSGSDSDNNAVQRMTFSAMAKMTPPKPVVRLKDRIYTVRGANVKIKCYVESQTPIRIRWFKNGRLTRVGKECSESCESIYSIPYVTDEDITTYTCDAESDSGSNSKKTRLLFETPFSYSEGPISDNVYHPFIHTTRLSTYTTTYETKMPPPAPKTTKTTHKTTTPTTHKTTNTTTHKTTTPTTHKTTNTTTHKTTTPTTHKTTNTTHKTTTPTTHKTTKTTHKTTTPTTHKTTKITTHKNHTQIKYTTTSKPQTKGPKFSLNYTVSCSVYNASTYNLTWEAAKTTNNSDILLPKRNEFEFEKERLNFANMTHDVTEILKCRSVGGGGKEILYAPTQEEIAKGKVKREAIELAFMKEYGNPEEVPDKTKSKSKTGLDSAKSRRSVRSKLPLGSRSKTKGKFSHLSLNKKGETHIKQ